MVPPSLTRFPLLCVSPLQLGTLHGTNLIAMIREYLLRDDFESVATAVASVLGMFDSGDVSPPVCQCCWSMHTHVHRHVIAGHAVQQTERWDAAGGGGGGRMCWGPLPPAATLSPAPQLPVWSPCPRTDTPDSLQWAPPVSSRPRQRIGSSGGRQEQTKRQLLRLAVKAGLEVAMRESRQAGTAAQQVGQTRGGRNPPLGR